MIDLHCHIDLYPNPKEVVDECARRKMYVLSVTTTPSAWIKTSALPCGYERIRTALGLHPQLAKQRKLELSLFDQLLPQARYVGEIGLDGGEEYQSSWDDQVTVFTHILNRCTEQGGRVLSIHSRKATSAVLGQLEKYPKSGIPILHWFSGNLKELQYAIQIGCWFSVGPNMLYSKKGMQIVENIPRDRIVTETDGPFAAINGIKLNPWDADSATKLLGTLWRTTYEDAVAIIEDNFNKLVRSYG